MTQLMQVGHVEETAQVVFRLGLMTVTGRYVSLARKGVVSLGEQECHRFCCARLSIACFALLRPQRATVKP